MHKLLFIVHALILQNNSILKVLHTTRLKGRFKLKFLTFSKTNCLLQTIQVDRSPSMVVGEKRRVTTIVFDLKHVVTQTDPVICLHKWGGWDEMGMLLYIKHRLWTTFVWLLPTYFGISSRGQELRKTFRYASLNRMHCNSLSHMYLSAHFICILPVQLLILFSCKDHQLINHLI